ncbi:MAG: hypothetical protein K9L78_02700 [Victivallales bacterium]|nr:hypothetical protein [Victivallales bacterium]
MYEETIAGSVLPQEKYIVLIVMAVPSRKNASLKIIKENFSLRFVLFLTVKFIRVYKNQQHKSRAKKLPMLLIKAGINSIIPSVKTLKPENFFAAI